MRQNPFQRAPQAPDQLFNSYDRGLYRITGNEETNSILNMMQGGAPGNSNAANVQVSPSDIGSGVGVGSTSTATGTTSAGKTGFDNTVPGYILGVDPNDGLSKFYIGNTTNFMNWTGTGLVISGSISASSIDIPDTTTANSFHVDSSGNAWWGATTLGSSVASILSTGVATFTKITINGGPNATFVSDTLDTSSKEILKDFAFSPSDYSGAFKSGNITWSTSTGAVTGGSGIIMYKNGIVGATSGAVTFSIDATTGNAAFSGAITASSVTGTTITGGTLQTAMSGQRIRLVSSSATSPTQSANSLMLINSSSHEIMDFGSNASIIMRILPIDNDTAGLLIQNDTSLASTQNMLEVDTANSSSSGTTVSISQAGSGSGLSVIGTGTNQTNYVAVFNSSALRNLVQISSSFNSNNSNIMLNVNHSGGSGSNTLAQFETVGLGTVLVLKNNNSSNTNPIVFGSVSHGGRIMELDQTNSSNANNALYVTTTNTAVAPIYAQGGTVNSHFQRMIGSGSYQIWVSDGTNPNGSLSANIGDLCLGGSSGHPYWNNNGSTGWTQI